MISEGGERRALGGVLREQKMLRGHLSRVIYHRVYTLHLTPGTGDVLEDIGAGRGVPPHASGTNPSTSNPKSLLA